ncbi:MepB family protein [Virgibacillus salarius]|nr:MepB family protein [Virgibacillus salarius]
MMKSIELIDSLLSCIGNYEITNVSEEKQNYNYEGVSFSVLDYNYRSRLAKLTPKKKGYFVVFWEKNTNNQNQAYSYYESPNKIIVTVIDNELKGQFIFPKSVLLKHGILSSEASKGKMAIRVYPAWENELNRSATKTQKWQINYFIDVSNGVDNERLTDLYFS